jgi:hypothetical protein
MYLEEDLTKRDGATCRDGWNNTPKKNSAKKEGIPPREKENH